MTQTTTKPQQQSNRRLHAVPSPAPQGGLSPTKHAVITALAQHPHGQDTSAALAEQAQIGASTARRLLAELVEQGLVTRTPGTGKGPGRTPDQFHLADQRADNTGTPAGSVPLAVVPPPEPTEAQALTVSTDNEPDTRPAVPDGQAAEAPTAASEQDLDEDPDLDPGAETAAAARETTQPTSAPTTAPASGTPPPGRLGKNALRGKVEQYLIEHPDQEFGPHALGQALGHSSGAITNVLAKLVQAGHARQTQTQPRRFTASTEQHT